MSESLTAQTLFSEYQNRLRLRWAYGKHIDSKALHPPPNKSHTYAGLFSYVHPFQITVFGKDETKYFNELDTRTCNRAIQQIYSHEPCMIIFADSIEPFNKILSRAKRYRVPVMISSLSGQTIIDLLNYHLSSHFADSQTLHGVFMDVLGVGVLLTGQSGVGKSELALGLINCGHRLIADDAVLFSRVAENKVVGSCPETLQDFLEVRGLGVINIRAMFGDNAIKESKRLQLIVKIVAMDNDELQNVDRLQGIHDTRQVLGIGVPEVTIPVAPGRNLAVLVEGAVRNQILQLTGYHASEEFIERQQKILEDQSS